MASGKVGTALVPTGIASSANVSISAVVKWLAGKAHPNNFRPVEVVFFGPTTRPMKLPVGSSGCVQSDPLDGRKWSTARNALKNAIKQQWVINGLRITVHMCAGPGKLNR